MEANGDNRSNELQLALAYAENIIATLREPFVVLDKSLRVRTANAAYRAHSLLLIIRGGVASSIAFSITSRDG